MRDRYCPNCQQFVAPTGHGRANQILTTIITLPLLVVVGCVAGARIGASGDSGLVPGVVVPWNALYGAGAGFAAWFVGAVLEFTRYHPRCPACRTDRLTRDAVGQPPPTPSGISPRPPASRVAVKRRSTGLEVLGGASGLLLIVATIGFISWSSDTCTLYVGDNHVNLTLQGWGSTSACHSAEQSKTNKLFGVIDFFTLGRVDGHLHEGPPAYDVICSGWSGHVHYTVQDSTGFTNQFTGHVMADEWCSGLRSG